MMMVMSVAMVSMTMAVLRFGVIRLILSGGDNEVDGDDIGGRDNADGDVGASDRNVLVLVAMTKMETMKTMTATIAMDIGALTESLLKTVMAMMVMAPILKRSR